MPVFASPLGGTIVVARISLASNWSAIALLTISGVLLLCRFNDDRVVTAGAEWLGEGILTLGRFGVRSCSDAPRSDRPASSSSWAGREVGRVDMPGSEGRDLATLRVTRALVEAARGLLTDALLLRSCELVLRDGGGVGVPGLDRRRFSLVASGELLGPELSGLLDKASEGGVCAGLLVFIMSS